MDRMMVLVLAGFMAVAISACATDTDWDAMMQKEEMKDSRGM